MFNFRSKRHILWFNEISKKDIPQVGGKNANLGEMYNNLSKQGIPIPNGFTVTSEAYKYFIKEAEIGPKIFSILKNRNKGIKALQSAGAEVRKLILNSKLPLRLQAEIIQSYRKLSKQYNVADVDVAVRSSATAEDLPGASFAGQQETYLNVKGERILLDSVKKCFASLYTDRAISYREEKGFKHEKVFLSVAVQKMIRSDKASSGVIFTIDTESGFDDVAFVTSAYGLGEYVVQGKANPDEFYIHQPTLKLGYKSLISKKLGTKKVKLIYSTHGTRNSPVSKQDQNKFSITDEEAIQLAKFATIIEDHYKIPMDIEWAKDGNTNKIYILQARPETVHAMKKENIFEEYILKQNGRILTKGLAVGEKIGNGEANLISSPKQMSNFRKGQVLVTEMTDPDWQPIMKEASAIVTNRGGKTCHAAIVSREMGIPCVVGTNDVTKKVKQGQSITVSCAEGEVGKVYAGKLAFEIKRTNIKDLSKTKTKVMLNVGLPESAFKLTHLPADGVGLAREEFIISEQIGIHPLALVHYDNLKKRKDPFTTNEIKKIDEKTKDYKIKTDFYVDKLTEGISKIGAAFYPRPVIVRFSDFKSNEYANLLGGKIFEPREENPMIGWRGASRYYSKEFLPAFKLECEAIRKVREEKGLLNVQVMIPFCRTIDEAKKVLQVMKENGLERGKHHLQVEMMVEIPSDVLLLEDFSKLFDGFSIGSNDLTQLTLGLDRDSSLVSSIFDERNKAVKNLVASAIRTAKKLKKKIGICGDAPSTYADFTKFLVEQGIDYISVSPDAFFKTKLQILKIEKS